VTEQAEVRRVLREWSETSFRLESLDEYTVESEAPRLGAFLRGEPVRPHDQNLEGWLERLRGEREQGKRRIRVHAIAGPLTPYLRYEIEWGYTANALAGEEIHLVHRDTWEETPFGRRPPDFYLLDDRTVVVMVYDEIGHWLGGDVITDPSEVARYREMRDQALASSVSLRDYLAAWRRTPVSPPAVERAALRASV
jgi:hypothetical protein